MTSPLVSFDARTGTIIAAPWVLRDLAVDGSRNSALIRAGVAARGRLHPTVLPTVHALRDPSRGVLQLSYQGHGMDGWCGRDHAALLLPEQADGRRTLVGIPTEALPDAIAKAAGLCSRPRPPAVVRPVHEITAGNDVVRRWRLIHGDVTRSRTGMLEVLDTDHGLYLVVGADSAVPSDAPAVLHLIRWLVEGHPIMPPLEPLPETATLPSPVLRHPRSAPSSGARTQGPSSRPDHDTTARV